MEQDTATDLFLSLTPHKVIEAVEASGVLCNRVAYPLNSFENRVYEVELEDRTRVVAKFYRPERWSRDQILEEHGFLRELAESEVPVCAPLPFSDGTTLRQIDHIWYGLFPRLGGRVPDEISDEAAARLGRLTARIHNVGDAAPSPTRLALTAEGHVRANLRWLEAHGVLPERVAARYRNAAERIAAEFDERVLGVPVHRLHGDLHRANLLLRDDTFHVVDFDDMVIGPAVQDVWLLLPGRDADTARHRAIFLDAYEELRRFDRATLRLVEPLRGLRMVSYAAWLAKRWHDPIFPRTFVHFGTADDWEERTRDLEEIVELTTDGRDGAVREEQPLSNADYFWDMKGEGGSR